MQPDAGIPKFYTLTFAPPYESLEGVLTNDQQLSAFDTSGSMYENTRLHIPQETGLLSVRLEDILTSCRGVTCFCTTAPSGQGLLIHDIFDHTQRRTTFGRTPLDE